MSKAKESNHKVLIFIGQAMLAIAILYVAGWEVIADAPQFNFLYLAGIAEWKDVLIDPSSLLFALDSKYYGLVVVDRFFDSSFLSWIGFFVAASIVLPFRFFFFSSSN